MTVLTALISSETEGFYGNLSQSQIYHGKERELLEEDERLPETAISSAGRKIINYKLNFGALRRYGVTFLFFFLDIGIKVFKYKV